MRSDLGDAIRTVLEERERLKKAHLEGLSGLEVVRGLAAAVDAAVGALWTDIAPGDRGVALVALGGYGRGELSPYSDLDLMVLHAGRAAAPEAGRQLFYALWDAGFQVGHAIRTIKDCLRLAKTNFEAETSFLEARLLSGDEALFADFADSTLRLTRKRGSKFLEALRSAMLSRHAKEGHASYLLEPNLKEGAGGLRDLHSRAWLARVFGDLERDEQQESDLRDAAELLHRVRNQLHFATDRRTDVLLLQMQEATALALGWHDAEGWSAWDSFMRDLYRAARTVEHAIGSDFVALEVPRRPIHRDVGGGLFVDSGRVKFSQDLTVAARPDLPIALFLASVRERASIDPSELRRLRDDLSRPGPELSWTEQTREAFFELLGTGDASALEGFDHVGALARYLPEWEPVRCRPQHNIYHRFTVDVHAYQTVAALARLGENPLEPLAAQVALEVPDREVALLAALLHDLGKGYPGDHSAVGEELSRRIARRIGLDESRTETLAWLVRNHLLLVDTATRRDTGDENLVVETAAQVREPGRLRMLYALSVADGLGTGPTAWNPWKSALVSELFSKTLHVLERGDLVSRDATELVRLRTTELRAGLERHPTEKVSAHIRGMPRAYFLAFPTTELIRHFALMADPLPAGEIRTHVTQTEEHELSELTVVSPDRPGLFSTVAGALALNGVNVVSAQIFTRADGAALEIFRVTGAFDEIEHRRWSRVFDDIRAALRGDLALQARLAEKRRAYASRPARARRRAPTVLIDNSASDFYTVVEVHAADRIGLLFAVTRALADLGLNIHLAKIATYGEDVVDVFYVYDLEGQKVVDTSSIAKIEQVLGGALDES